MVGGAVVAYTGDLTFSIVGYALTLVSAAVNAGYLVCIRYTKQRTGSGEFEMMYYNNILSLPFVLVMMLAFELEGMRHYEFWFNTGFLVCFFMSSVLAFLLNYFIFLCSTVNSPLTTSVTGQVKAVLTVVIGLFFDDVVVTPMFMIGLGMSCLGSVYYAVVKYRQQQAAKSQPKEEELVGAAAAATTTKEKEEVDEEEELKKKQEV